MLCSFVVHILELSHLYYMKLAYVCFNFSAGVGRSGTFIALDSLLQQAESEGKIDVYSYVTQMRKQRCNMIQTLVCVTLRLINIAWLILCAE